MDTIDYRLHEGDVTFELCSAAEERGLIACDTETTGLDFINDSIAMLQVYVPGANVEVIRLNGEAPKRFLDLLVDSRVCKVFHHATFDLRFFRARSDVTPRNVACTKIAAKILDGSQGPEYSLGPLLDHYFGIKLDKSLQTSDWLAEDLTPAQLEYAVQDVIHLPRLLDHLSHLLVNTGRMWIAEGCWNHLPIRVELEVAGYPDPFQY